MEKQGDSFERWVIDNVKCPACKRKLKAFKSRSHPAVDLFCSSRSCNVQIQVKQNKASTKKSHASSYEAMQSLRRKIGDKNIFFVIGTEKRFSVWCLADKARQRKYVREYRPASALLRKKTGLVNPDKYGTWADVARAFGLMIRQQVIDFAWS